MLAFGIMIASVTHLNHLQVCKFEHMPQSYGSQRQGPAIPFMAPESPSLGRLDNLSLPFPAHFVRCGLGLELLLGPLSRILFPGQISRTEVAINLYDLGLSQKSMGFGRCSGFVKQVKE